jgi:hypothetical protein
MYSPRVLLPAAALLAVLAGSEAASAATLWRGVVVVTSRTATTLCMNEYDVGETFEILYRPNLGAAFDETIEVMGPNGAMLVTSTDPTDRTLRTGSVSIIGAAYAIGYSFANASNPINMSPASITASTVTIGMNGTLKNAGLPGCNVGFKASLLPVFDGPL